MSKKINALKVNIGPLHGFDFIPIFDPTVGEEERITVDKLKSYVLSGFTGSITGGTSIGTIITGFTYNNSNKLTISQNQGQSDLSVFINQFSGLTINGNLDVTGLTTTKGITSTGGVTFKQVTVTSTYSATTEDYLIDVSGGTFSVYLPSAIGIQGRILCVKNNGGGAVTVQPVLGQTLDDKPYLILSETNAVQIVSNGSQWVILGQDRSTVNNSTGVFEFSGLSKVSSTQFSVAPVRGWIVDDTTNPLSPQILYVDYSGGTYTDSYVTTTFETFVYLTSGATIGQQSTPLTEQERRQNIFLGKLGHPEKTSINLVFSQPDFVLSPLAQLRDIFAPINLINGGVYPSANGVNLKFNTSAGYLYGLGINFALNTLAPNSLIIPGTSPCTFQYRTQTGGTVTNITDIDPLNYDVGGIKTPITGTKATNQRIFLLQNGTFRVQYGQHEYNTLTQAIEALQTETFTPFPNFVNNAILIGILSVLSTATDLTDSSKAKFFFASKFGETIGAAGGVSTTNLQQAYNNSSTPEIVINSLLDGLSIKNGTGNGDSSTHLLEGINTAGSVTSFISADGSSSFSTISASTKVITENFQMLSGASNNYILTSDSLGNARWSSPSNYSAGPISGSTGWSSTGSGQMNLPDLKVSLFNNPNNLGSTLVYDISSGTTGSGGIPSLTNNDTNYIVVEYNNGSPIYNVYTNDSVINDSDVVLVYISYRANNFIHTLEFGNYGSGLPNKLNDRFVMTDRFGWESGLSLGLSGNTGTVTLDSGVVWDASYRQSLIAVNSQSNTFFKNYHSGGTWVYSTTGKTINNSYYDTSSDIVLATAGKYLVNWYYRGQEVSGHLYEVYGTSQYDTVADAELSVEPLLPELVTSHAFLTGRIIVQVGSNTGLTQSAFVRVFQSTQVTNHNDLLGIQGGTSGQYYHLNSNQYNNIALTNTNNNFIANQTINGVLQATTISASTYQNLPIDIRVTGGTYSNGVATFTNNTGGTFNVTGFSTGYTLTSSAINTALGYTPLSAYTDTYVTGGTYSNGSITLNRQNGFVTITGLTTGYTLTSSAINTVLGYTPLSAYTDTYVTGGTYSNGSLTLNRQNGIVSITGFSTGYTLTSSAINTALGYTPLSAYTDTFVTGGTYSLGTLTLNRQNGSVSITGLTTGYTLTSSAINTALGYTPLSAYTDTYVTGFTYNNSNKLTISRNVGQPDLNVYINQLSGLTVNGLLQATTISASTYQNLPRDIYVTGGTYNAGTGIATFTNSTGGTFTVTGFNTGSGTSTGLTASNYVVQGKLNANQAIPNGVDTIIQFIDDFDPQNWWDASTYKFTPNIAGYYYTSFGVWFDNPATGATLQLNIQARKNGNSLLLVQQPAQNGTGIGLGGSKIVYLNGTTDYLDFTAYNGTTTTKNILQGTAEGSGTWFSAALITGLNSTTFTASNLGSGTGIFAQKSGFDFQYKSLTSTGNTVSISNNSTTVNLEAKDTYVTGATYASNTLTIKQNQGLPDVTTTIGLISKANSISGSSFTGNPKTYQVTFITPYPSTSYSINITGSDARTFTYESKTTTGFIINSNANTSLTGNVDWQTMRNGES